MSHTRARNVVQNSTKTSRSPPEGVAAHHLANLLVVEPRPVAFRKIALNCTKMRMNHARFCRIHRDFARCIAILRTWRNVARCCANNARAFRKIALNFTKMRMNHATRTSTNQRIPTILRCPWPQATRPADRCARATPESAPTYVPKLVNQSRASTFLHGSERCRVYRRRVMRPARS